MLPLICDLPQIVYIYIYSSVAETVSYSSGDYLKLRAIVNENSADADNQLLKDIQIFRQDLMPMNVINPVQRKTKLLIQEPLQIETYSVVWIQDNNNSKHFRHHHCLEIFFNIKECIDYIKSSSSDTETILKEVSPLLKV